MRSGTVTGFISLASASDRLAEIRVAPNANRRLMKNLLWALGSLPHL
jgi:hypothetical protein